MPEYRPETNALVNGYSSREQTGLSPLDYGLKAWNQPLPQMNGGTILSASGLVHVMKLWLPAMTVTNVCVGIATAGVTLTANQCLAGLFDANKNLLSATADQSSSWTSSGGKTMALTTPQTVSAGYYYVGFYANGTTLPNFLRQSTNACVNNYESAAGSLFATADTGRTTSFPATLGTLTALSTGYWVGVS